MKRVVENVLAVLADLDMTTDELAEAIDMPIHVMREVLTGQRRLSSYDLARIDEATDRTVTNLLTGTEKPYERLIRSLPRAARTEAERAVDMVVVRELTPAHTPFEHLDQALAPTALAVLIAEAVNDLTAHASTRDLPGILERELGIDIEIARINGPAAIALVTEDARIIRLATTPSPRSSTPP